MWFYVCLFFVKKNPSEPPWESCALKGRLGINKPQINNTYTIVRQGQLPGKVGFFLGHLAQKSAYVVLAAA